MINAESTPVSRWEPTPRWERRYREVLDVAATAFAEKGYLGASTKDIADRLGIRAASLYYYFPSKEAALAAICEFGVKDFIAHLRDILARPVEPGVFYNVNLPLLPTGAPDPEVVWCPLDPKPLPLNYRHEEESGLYFAGDYSLRHRTPGADVDVCFGGNIAVTAVRLL